MTMSQKPVHFGPVWGRPPSQSMALCMDGKEPGTESRTMTRTAKITCAACLGLLSIHQLTAAQAKDGGAA